jgi:hypothetical protein
MCVGGSRGEYIDTKVVKPVLITWGQSSHNIGPEQTGFCVCVTMETTSSKGSFIKKSGKNPTHILITCLLST